MSINYLIESLLVILVLLGNFFFMWELNAQVSIIIERKGNKYVKKH